MVVNEAGTRNQPCSTGPDKFIHAYETVIRLGTPKQQFNDDDEGEEKGKLY